MKLKILDSRITPDMVRPETAGSAAIDLRISTKRSLLMFPYQESFIGTGVAIHIPDGKVGLIFPRSSMGRKGIVLGNGTGVIDSDYRDEIKLLLINRHHEGMAVELQPLERVAQLVVVDVTPPHWEVVDEIEQTGRGGFGSTGRV